MELELRLRQIHEAEVQQIAQLLRIGVLRFSLRRNDVGFENIAVLDDECECLRAVVFAETVESFQKRVFAVDEEANGGFVDDAVEGLENGANGARRNREAEAHSEVGEESDVEAEPRGGTIGLNLVQQERNELIRKDQVVESTAQPAR